MDLNRAGVPLLEIVTEPDLHSAEEVRAYAMALRAHPALPGGQLGRYAKRRHAHRAEYLCARRWAAQELGTRTEIKNLNSFRALERSVAYEIQRQIDLIRTGGRSCSGNAWLG